MDVKTWLGIVTVVMTIGAHIVYVMDIFSGKTKPHIYSWLLWALLTVIVFISLVINEGGAGSWSTGTAGAISILITILALKYGTKNITKSDTFFLIVALSIIPLWFITNSLLASVILATAIDAIAFIPTLRKTWQQPLDETLSLYIVNTIRHALVLFALNSFVFINYIYPIMLVLANALVASFIIYRKPIVKNFL